MTKPLIRQELDKVVQTETPLSVIATQVRHGLEVDGAGSGRQWGSPAQMPKGSDGLNDSWRAS